MWTLAKICTVLATCFAMVSSATAIDRSQPFVAVAVQSRPLYLGEVYGPGLKQIGAQVNARVMANCPYHVEASFQGLRHVQGKATISAKNMLVVINGREIPVGTGRVPVASSNEPTPYDGVDVPIELQVGVRGLEYYPAGRYGGALVITVMAGP